MYFIQDSLHLLQECTGDRRVQSCTDCHEDTKMTNPLNKIVE